MKKSIEELLDNADAASMDGLLDGIENAKAPKGMPGRVCEKLGFQTGKNTFRRTFYKRYAAVACAAVFVAACVAVTLAVRGPDITDPGDGKINSGVKTGTVSSAEPVSEPAGEISTEQSAEGSSAPPPVPAYEVIKLHPAPETNDRFTEDPQSGELGGAGSAAADRVGYYGLRFFEDETGVYMNYGERTPIYKYENGSFVLTGMRSPERLNFSSGMCGGYVYVGGTALWCGSPGCGLFRVDPRTGTAEEFIDCSAVGYVAVSGNKLYYSTWGYIKCADLEKREITVILETEEKAWIEQLRIVDGDLFFTQLDKLYRITPDMEMYRITEETWRYSVVDGVVYNETFTDQKDAGNRSVSRTYTVTAYDLYGNETGSADAVLYVSEDPSRRSGERFSGEEFFDEPTVFGGKLVSFGNDAVYLRDIASGEKEKIIDLSQLGRYPRVLSAEVFGGKLFVEVYTADDNRRTVLEYDGESVKAHGVDILK